MAPRPTKSKKAADVKVVETETQKGRGKAKQIEVAELDLSDPEMVEKAAPEKKKRGRKAAETNGKEDLNEVPEQKEPAAKRGKKKVEPEVNGSGDKDGSPVSTEEVEQTDENIKPNGHTEAVANGKGKKKSAKKETEKSDKPARGKKAKTESATEENGEGSEESATKPAAKGRGRKAKTDKETEQKAETGEDIKTEPTSKGRKKAPAKATPESQDDQADDVPKNVPAPKGKKKTPAKIQDGKSPEDPNKDELAPKSKKKTPAKPDVIPEPEGDKVEEELNEVAEDTPEEKKPAKAKKAPSKKAQAKVDAEENAPESDPSAKKKKVAKKEEKEKGDVKDEDPVEEEQSEPKVKGKKGQKKVVDAPEEADEEPEDTGEPNSKRRRKVEEKAPAKGKAKAPVINKASTNYDSIDFSNTSKNAQGKEWNFKISSWNVGGIRAWMMKGGLDFIKHEKPDILCLQEVKCAHEKLPEEAANIPGYHAYWLCSEKDGYAGVGIYTTKLAISVQYGLQNEELDTEGRIITAEYEEFYLICTYVPNAGRKLVTLDKRLQWNEEFRKHVKELDKKKPVIICGDMNVAHNEIDLKNPSTNKKNAGFTEEERSGMTELLAEGFVDTYRHMYPEKTGAYTFWSYMMNSRAKNTGWRLDYFLVSERLMATICDNMIRDGVYGSDHCPITLFLHLTSAEHRLSDLRSS